VKTDKFRAAPILALDNFFAHAGENFLLRRAVLNETLPAIYKSNLQIERYNFMVKLSFLRRRRLAAATLSFAVALVVFAVPQRAAVAQSATVKTATQKSLSAKERAEVFERVWKTVDEKYYDPKFNGVDWKAVREQFRPLVERAATDAEFYDVLTLMVGELRDAHTRVRSPRRREESKSRQATSAGVRVGEVEGVPVISSVAPDSDAARAGVAAGMIVRTVGGRAVGEALSDARREVGTSSSERATRLLAFSRVVAGEPETQLELGLTRADGTPLEVSLTRRRLSAAPQFVANLLPSGFAYIKFNQFQAPVDEQIKDALVKFKDAPALLLDLRSNGGGDGALGLRIAGYFFDERVSFANIITRTGKPLSAFFGLYKLPKEFKAGKKGGQLYARPVVILINEATGSTSELFAEALQEQKRATVIGTQSCGCVLGILGYTKLKGDGDLAVSEIGFVTAKGRTLEGNGVVPDNAIAATLTDVQNGRDVALEEAIRYLENLKAKQ